MKVIMGKNNANRHGTLLEGDVLKFLVENGFSVYDHKVFKLMDFSSLPDKFVVKRVPMPRLWNACGYGNPRRSTTEFVLHYRTSNDLPYKKVRVECKNQPVCGSTIDKIAMAIIDLRYFSPTDEDKAFLVLEGKEYDRRMSAIQKMSRMILIVSPAPSVRRIPMPVEIGSSTGFKLFVKNVITT